MTAVWSIMRREIQAYFVSPMAYAFITIFLVVVAFGFTSGVIVYASTPAMVMQEMGMSLRTQLVAGRYGLITWGTFAVALSLPGLAMRLLSEERKSGTAELLFTSPITTTHLVLGKYFGTLSVYALILILTLPLPGFLFFKAQPEAAALACAYLGLFLYGGVMVAIGLFTSCLTENQFIGLVLTYVIAVPLVIIELVVPIARAPWDAILASLSIGWALKQSSLGLLDTSYLALDVVLIVAFLFLSVRVLDSSRWR
jgi:ABC-2 type transport system permease protein